MLKCPKCGSKENIIFFLRHQKESEDDESTNANCITMLHEDPDCGYNQSFLLIDCLEELFPDWSDIPERLNKIQEQQSNMFSALGNMMNEIPIEADNVEVIEDEQPILPEGNDEDESNVAADSSDQSEVTSEDSQE